MRIFISGGCKNGKSSYAQKLVQKIRKPDAPLYYLATMIPADSEDTARILRHRAEREGCGFQTIETGRDILSAVKNCDSRGAFLLDSVTALLALDMFTPRGRVNSGAREKTAASLTWLLRYADDIVVVSDYIYSDAFLYDGLTELYRKNLAAVDRHAAGLCDVVLEVSCGIYLAHKGESILKEISA